jgi:hypothetical protein
MMLAAAKVQLGIASKSYMYGDILRPAPVSCQQVVVPFNTPKGFRLKADSFSAAKLAALS